VYDAWHPSPFVFTLPWYFLAQVLADVQKIFMDPNEIRIKQETLITLGVVYTLCCLLNLNLACVVTNVEIPSR
jgi:ABC-type Fe3+ transport system permease subunit